MAQRHLAIVERHVAQGDLIVGRQRELIAVLERVGRDTTGAIELLGNFEILQAAHIAHRLRLMEDLATFPTENKLPLRAGGIVFEK